MDTTRLLTSTGLTFGDRYPHDEYQSLQVVYSMMERYKYLTASSSTKPKVYDGIDGTLVADFNPGEQADYATHWTDPLANEWTVHSTSQRVRIPTIPCGCHSGRRRPVPVLAWDLWQLRSRRTLLTCELRATLICGAMSLFQNGRGAQRGQALYCRPGYGGTVSTMGYLLRILPNGSLRLYWSDGSTFLSASSYASVGLNDGRRKLGACHS